MSAQEHAAIVRDVLLGRDHWKDGIAALDALVADNERLTARVEQFERHVETVIEPKLLRRAEEAEAEVERLLNLLGPDYHVYEQREEGWSIKHPVSCREEMLDCPIHIEASALYGPPVAPGRYRADLLSGNLTFTRIDAARAALAPEPKP